MYLLTILGENSQSLQKDLYLQVELDRSIYPRSRGFRDLACWSKIQLDFENILITSIYGLRLLEVLLKQRIVMHHNIQTI